MDLVIFMIHWLNNKLTEYLNILSLFDRLKKNYKPADIACKYYGIMVRFAKEVLKVTPTPPTIQ